MNTEGSSDSQNHSDHENMERIEIYEFYRAFDNIRLVNGDYVSGGYSPDKINRSNYGSGDISEIPSKIKEYVFSGYFAINDNYPPEENQFALIARKIRVDDPNGEISGYAVLAVANRQKDDGGRPTIGYRYFWLKEQIDSGNDWLGFLTNWWLEHPRFFVMKEAFQSPKIDVVIEKIGSDNLDLIFNKYSKDNIPLINYYQQQYNLNQKIESYNKIVDITVSYKRTIDPQINQQLLEIHRQAWCLSYDFKLELAWAWNVNRLVYSDSFLVIYHASESEEAQNSPNIQILQDSSEDNTTAEIISTTRAQIIRQNFAPIPKNPIIRCLIGTVKEYASDGNNNKKLINDLINFLEDYPDADWSNFVDNTYLSNASDAEVSIYESMLALLVRDRTKRWLEKTSVIMMEKQSRLQSDVNKKVLTLQSEIIKTATKKSAKRAHEYLLKSQENGISELLFNILHINDDKTIKNTLLGFLDLCKDEIIWQQSLKRFLISLYNHTHEQKNGLKESSFATRVVEDIKKSLEGGANNIPKLHPEYSNFCMFVKEIEKQKIINLGNLSLLGVFHFLETGDASKDKYLTDRIPKNPMNELQQLMKNIIENFVKSNKIEELQFINLCELVEEVKNGAAEFDIEYMPSSNKEKSTLEALVVLLVPSKAVNWVEMIVKSYRVFKPTKCFDLLFSKQLWRDFFPRNDFLIQKEIFKLANKHTKWLIFRPLIHKGISNLLLKYLNLQHNQQHVAKIQLQTILHICKRKESGWSDYLRSFIHGVWVDVYPTVKTFSCNNPENYCRQTNTSTSTNTTNFSAKVLKDFSESICQGKNSKIFKNENYLFLADLFYEIKKIDDLKRKTSPRNPDYDQAFSCLIVIFYLFSGSKEKIPHSLKANSAHLLSDVFNYFNFEFPPEHLSKSSSSLLSWIKLDFKSMILIFIILSIIIWFCFSSNSSKSNNLLDASWLRKKNVFYDSYINQTQKLLKGIDFVYLSTDMSYLKYSDNANENSNTLRAVFIMIYRLQASFKNESIFLESNKRATRCMQTYIFSKNQFYSIPNMQQDPYLACLVDDPESRKTTISKVYAFMRFTHERHNQQELQQRLKMFANELKKDE